MLQFDAFAHGQGTSGRPLDRDAVELYIAAEPEGQGSIAAMNRDRCYEILGLRSGASPHEVRQAYRDLAKVWHPDRFSNDPRLQARAQEQFAQIHSAYAALSSGREHFDWEPPRRRNRPAFKSPDQRRELRGGAAATEPLAYQRFIISAKIIAAILILLMVRGLLTICIGKV